MIRTINGKDYTFKITRKGLRMAEQQGMKINDMADKPMSALYYLWYSALCTTQPMQMSKSDDLLDTYLDDPNTTETMADVLSSLTEDFNVVFGQAVE